MWTLKVFWNDNKEFQVSVRITFIYGPLHLFLTQKGNPAVTHYYFYLSFAGPQASSQVLSPAQSVSHKGSRARRNSPAAWSPGLSAHPNPTPRCPNWPGFGSPLLEGSRISLMGDGWRKGCVSKNWKWTDSCIFVFIETVLFVSVGFYNTDTVPQTNELKGFSWTGLISRY